MPSPYGNTAHNTHTPTDYNRTDSSSVCCILWLTQYPTSILICAYTVVFLIFARAGVFQFSIFPLVWLVPFTQITLRLLCAEVCCIYYESDVGASLVDSPCRIVFTRLGRFYFSLNSCIYFAFIRHRSKQDRTVTPEKWLS